jgi:hypothetical protein
MWGIKDSVERWAYYLDVFRVMPRLALIAYGYSFHQTASWFMDLKDPTAAQGAFISVITGVAPLILNFYMQQGVDWEKRIAMKKEQMNVGNTGTA